MDTPHSRRATHRWRRILIWITGSVTGVAVLALPDSGPRVLSFSGTHGPSAIDVVGILVLIAAWMPVAAMTWSQRAALRHRRGLQAMVLGLVGVSGLVGTIALDLGTSWVAAVAAIVAAQVMALRALAS